MYAEALVPLRFSFEFLFYGHYQFFIFINAVVARVKFLVSFFIMI